MGFKPLCAPDRIKIEEKKEKEGGREGGKVISEHPCSKHSKFYYSQALNLV